MPKEIKILLPDVSEQDYLNITISNSKSERLLHCRFEKWDRKKDNPENLNSIQFIEQKVKALKGKWEIAEIYNEENAVIPVLLKLQS